MRPWTKYLILLAFSFAGNVIPLLAQASPAARRMLDLSAFGGVSQTQTGIADGHNLALTAGLDLGVKAYRGFEFALEGRATYAMNPGIVVGENEALGGLRVERHMSRVHPYVTILLGHGDLNYQSGGFRMPNRYIYYQTNSNILSVGGGAAVHLRGNVFAIFDIQMQHWNSPVASDNSIISVPVSIGFAYHLPCRENDHPYP